VSPSQVSNRAVVHLCVVTFRQSQSSCSDKEDRAEHQVMLARQALFASLQRVRMKATTLYMPNNMTCFVPVICRHSTIEQSSCSNEEHRAAQVEAQSPRDQSHHSEREVILHQGSRLPKRDHPVPWTFFKTRTAAHLPHLGNQDQPGPARSSRVARPSGPSAWTPIRPVGPARHPPPRSLGQPQKTSIRVFVQQQAQIAGPCLHHQSYDSWQGGTFIT